MAGNINPNPFTTRPEIDGTFGVVTSTHWIATAVGITFSGSSSGPPYCRRNAIRRNHTGTHLLHWALHEVVSRDATQKGSYVGPDKLTFDFSSAALTPQQVRDVERLVN